MHKSVWSLVTGFFLTVTITTMEAAIDTASISTILSELSEGIYDRMDELVSMGDDVVPVLIQRANDTDGRIRRVVVDALGRIDLKDNGIVDKTGVINMMRDVILQKDRAALTEAYQYLLKADPRLIGSGLTPTLLELGSGGHTLALLLIGYMGDTSAIPTLKELLKSNDKSVVTSSKKALAKLEKGAYLQEIIKELPPRNQVGEIPLLTYFQYMDAFEALAYVKDKSVVRIVASYLTDNSQIKSPYHDVPYGGSYRFVAAGTLQQLVDNPPIKKKSAALLTEEDIQIWIKWWQEHQQEYP